MKWLLTFSILLFIVGSIVFTGKPSESQLGKSPIIYDNFIVALDVSCGYAFGQPRIDTFTNFDETTYNQVVSYMKTELRSFNDVDIAKEHGDRTH